MNTTLDTAVKGPSIELIEHLLGKGAKIKKNTIISGVYGNVEVLKYILDKYIDKNHDIPPKAFEHAAELDNHQILKLLLEYDNDVSLDSLLYRAKKVGYESVQNFLRKRIAEQENEDLGEGD